MKEAEAPVAGTPLAGTPLAGALVAGPWWLELLVAGPRWLDPNGGVPGGWSPGGWSYSGWNPGGWTLVVRPRWLDTRGWSPGELEAMGKMEPGSHSPCPSLSVEQSLRVWFPAFPKFLRLVLSFPYFFKKAALNSKGEMSDILL